MGNIVLYSTGCPKCKILKKKLDDKGIKYEEVNEKEKIMAKGVLSVPWLEVNGDMMDFGKSIKWVNEQ